MAPNPNSTMKLVGACVSKEPVETEKIGEIPLYKYDSPVETAPRGTVERVAFVAALRNYLMGRILKEEPGTTHVLMVDSYYLDQKETILELVKSYDDEKFILGASTLAINDTIIGAPVIRFYDYGTTPEGWVAFSGNERYQHGRIRVRAVGACYIFPVAAWLRNGYQCNGDYFEPEHVSLCKGFTCYLSLDHRLWRDPVRYSFRKKMRVAAGYYRRRWLHV